MFIHKSLFAISKIVTEKSYWCGIGIVGGRIGGWGIEGGADRVVRNGDIWDDRFYIRLK